MNVVQGEYESQIGHKRASDAELDNLGAKLVRPAVLFYPKPNPWQCCE